MSVQGGLIGIQLDITPEMEVFNMLFERCYTINRKESLKQDKKYFNFLSKIQLDHPLYVCGVRISVVVPGCCYQMVWFGHISHVSCGMEVQHIWLSYSSQIGHPDIQCQTSTLLQATFQNASCIRAE